MYKELLNYQEIDAKLREIETQISGSEECKKTVQAKRFLDGVNETRTAMEKRAEILVNLFEDLQNVKTALEEESKEIASGKASEEETEVNFLQKKAEELYKKLQSLEEKAASLSEEVQGLFAQYNQLRKNTSAAKNQFNEYAPKYKALKDEKKADISAIESELEKLAKSIDPELLQKYKAKRKDKMFPILYKLEGKACGHCLMELSMAEISKLSAGEIIECDNCRSLIYKEEE